MGLLSLTSNWPEASCRISVGGTSYSTDVELSLPNGSYVVTANFVYGYVTPVDQTVVLTDAGASVNLDWVVDSDMWQGLETKVYANLPAIMVCRDGLLRRVV